jgi:dolichol-phosphate mannosyltransferase
MAPPVLSIVLPAYREEENLRLLLPRIHAAARALPGGVEVLVVDTVAPLDATPALCEREGIRYLRRGPTNAYADAVRTGVAAARGEWILFMDADGSHAPELVPALFARRADADVVIASRYVAGGHTENSRALVLMSWVVNVCYRVVLGLRVKDVSNSFKLYRGEWLRSLELRCDNFDVIEEILYKLRTAYGARMVEVPATFRKRMFGETKRNLVAFMLSYVATLVRLRFSARAVRPRHPAEALKPGME